MENTNTVKVKNDTHVASDESSNDAGVYMPSTCCVEEAEREECPGLLKDQCCSYTKACPTSFNDKNQVTRLKVKDLAHLKEEVDPSHVTCPAVKREHDETARELQLGPNAEYTHFHDVGHETFPLQSTKESHECSHSMECPHACGICNKSFSTRSVLKTHQEILSQDNPFSCDVCNNSFSAKGSVKKHQQFHTKKRSQFCHICRRYFASITKLKKHQRLHTVLVPKVTCTSQRNSFATSCEERKVPSGKGGLRNVEEGVRRTYTKWKNRNVALMEEVVTISQYNEEETEVTACFAADEATHQNHAEVKEPQEIKEPQEVKASQEVIEPQEVIAPQEVKETISVSAAGLKLMTEQKEQDHADFCFLQSLVPDMKKLSDRKKRKFKELMLSSIGQLLEED